MERIARKRAMEEAKRLEQESLKGEEEERRRRAKVKAEAELKGTGELWKAASGGGRLDRRTNQAHARRWELEILGEGSIQTPNDLEELRLRRRRDSIVKKTVLAEVQKFYDRREREK